MTTYGQIVSLESPIQPIDDVSSKHLRTAVLALRVAARAEVRTRATWSAEAAASAQRSVDRNLAKAAKSVRQAFKHTAEIVPLLLDTMEESIAEASRVRSAFRLWYVDTAQAEFTAIDLRKESMFSAQTLRENASYVHYQLARLAQEMQHEFGSDAIFLVSLRMPKRYRPRRLSTRVGRS